MATRKRRDIKQSVVVVLEGMKICSNGYMNVAPLLKAVKAVDSDEEIMVLILLHYNQSGAFHTAKCYYSYERDPHMKFLHHEVNQRKAGFLEIFMPFYQICKNNGVRLQVKIAAGFRPKEIIMEEANNVKATWIVMDRCFTEDLTFKLSGINCNVSLVSSDNETMVHNGFDSNSGQRVSEAAEVNSNPKSPKLMRGEVVQMKPDFCHSSPMCDTEWKCPEPPPLVVDRSTKRDGGETREMSKGSKRSVEVMLLEKGTAGNGVATSAILQAGLKLGEPFHLSFEVIKELTGVGSRIMIHELAGDSTCILEAEKKAAMHIHHKNILRLLCYHRAENVTLLVFPFAKASLDSYTRGSSEKVVELTFNDKMKISIGIAEAVRYMLEEFPGGPIVHGDLLAHNIFLGHDFQPMISGFGKSRTLSSEKPSDICSQRCQMKVESKSEMEDLLKSDIFSYGVLLLRLFFRRTLPQNDKNLIELARPLMRRGALYELLDDDKDIDMHGIYRVMSAATHCTRTRPELRPSMSEVIFILKGEEFCAMQSSPSIHSTDIE